MTINPEISISKNEPKLKSQSTKVETQLANEIANFTPKTANSESETQLSPRFLLLKLKHN